MVRYVNDEQESVVEVWPAVDRMVQLRRRGDTGGPLVFAPHVSDLLEFFGYHRDDSGDT